MSESILNRVECYRRIFATKFVINDGSFILKSCVNKVGNTFPPKDILKLLYVI